MQTQKCLCIEEIESIGVSGDGSCKKSSFKSLFGIVSLIGLYAGKGIGVIIKCSSCALCKRKALQKDTVECDQYQW